MRVPIITVASAALACVMAAGCTESNSALTGNTVYQRDDDQAVTYTNPEPLTNAAVAPVAAGKTAYHHDNDLTWTNTTPDEIAR